MFRTALLEVSHWHVPLYLDGIRKAGLNVVGVTDREGWQKEAIAAAFGCPVYADTEELLAANAVELAFVFGRHDMMPRLAESLIRRHIPFSIEKPCGRTAEDVRRLRDYADAEGVFVAVPLWSRLSDLLAEIRALGEGGGATRFDHIAFHFLAGPPSRYEAAGAAWMLDPDVAGGGCLINLAAHLIDLCLIMLGADIALVHGRSSHRGFGAAVEDYFLLTMATADGGIATVETGYTFPMTDTEQREFSFSMSSATHYVRSTADGIRIYERLRRAAAREKQIRLDADVYYSPYVERVVSDLRRGDRPAAGLWEAEAVMRIVDAAYLSARENRVVSLA